MSKPAVFIGSSTEGLSFARAVRFLLDRDSETTMWNEGFFKALGSTFIETLVKELPRFDFAILVLTPDDLVYSREIATFGPRDNVIFELGLFMGGLGRSRTFLLHQANAQLKIPTDLSGVTTATYEWPRADGNHEAAVGSACDNIRNLIRGLGVSEAKTKKQISEIRSRQETTESHVRTLQLLIKGLVTEYEFDKLRGLAGDGPFKVEYQDQMLTELRRLLALGYARLQPGYRTRVIQIHDHRGEFDLKEYFSITDEGLEYLTLRNEQLSFAVRS
jgi:hypothetical protein